MGDNVFLYFQFIVDIKILNLNYLYIAKIWTKQQQLRFTLFIWNISESYLPIHRNVKKNCIFPTLPCVNTGKSLDEKKKSSAENRS